MCGILFYDNFCDQILGKFFQDDPMCHFNCVMLQSRIHNEAQQRYRYYIVVSFMCQKIAHVREN